MINLKSLEIHASYHCNLNCKDCMHLSFYEKKMFINKVALKNDLSVLKKHVDVDTVRILGGEPLLNPDLIDIVNVLKDSNLSKEVSLSTNGLLLKKYREFSQLWNNLDVCEVTIYESSYKKAIVKEILNCIVQISKNYNLKFQIYFCNYFRKPFNLLGIDDDKVVDKIYKFCPISKVWQCFNLDNGKLFPCPQSMALYRLGFDVKNDYVNLYSSDVQKKIVDMCNKKKHFGSCKYCYGGCGILGEHSVKNDLLDDYYDKSIDKNIDFDFLENILVKGFNNIKSLNTVDKEITVINGKFYS